MPAAFLAVAGGVKLVAPSGTPPESFEPLLARVPYDALLRALGVFELLVAAHLASPRTRRTGAGVAFALLAAFAFLLAANAHDGAFARNCGCLGVVSAGSRGIGALLVRNAALCWLLAAVFLPEGRLRWIRAGAVAALVLTSTLFAAERTLRRHDAAVTLVADAGVRAARLPGIPLTEIDLLTPDGRRTSSALAFRDGDHLVFFSAHCGECRRMAPAWPPFARRLAERGRRLVLVAAADPDAVGAFKAEFGCEDIPHFTAVRTLDLARWGISDLPSIAVLDDGGRLGSSLALLAPRAGELVRGVVQGLAAVLFGGAPSVGVLPARQGSFLLADVGLPGDRRGVFALGTIVGTPPFMLELAIGIDGDGRIGRIVPVTAAGYAQVVDPDGTLFGPLEGRTPAEAARYAETAAGSVSMEAPLWESVALLLGALDETLDRRP